jgi:deoxyhypusine synthase
MMKNHVVVYSDTTIAAPIVFSYALATRKKRKPKRLFSRLPALGEALRKAHQKKHPGSNALPEMKDSAKAKTMGPGRALPRR